MRWKVKSEEERGQNGVAVKSPVGDVRLGGDAQAVCAWDRAEGRHARNAWTVGMNIVIPRKSRMNCREQIRRESDASRKEGV